MLVAAGLDANSADLEGNTPLLIAVSLMDASIAIALVLPTTVIDAFKLQFALI